MSQRRLVIGALGLFVALHLAACGSSAGKETVAVVGPVSVSRAELEHWTVISEHAGHQRAAEARSHALDYLIVSAWVRAEAKRRGVVIAAGEVGRAIESRAATFVGGPDAFKAGLAHSGRTIADARLQVETELLYERLESTVAAGIRIPSATVADYYRRHRRRFSSPERRYFLSDSRMSMRQAASDRARVLAGQPFPAGALHESLSSTELNKGGPRKRKIAQAIFAARPRVPIGPFHNEPVEFYTLIEVTRIVPPRYEPLERVRARIENSLRVSATREAREAFRRAWQARWRTATHCLHGAEAPACDPAGAPVALRL